MDRVRSAGTGEKHAAARASGSLEAGIVGRLAGAGVEVIPDGEFPCHRRIYAPTRSATVLEFLEAI